MSTTTPRVVVVGAGAAGLTAARGLHDDHQVVVVDKGRGVGGRMATRRIGDATFDHGAQFITTHDDEFAEQVAQWSRAGVVQPWYRGRVGPAGVVGDDGHVRHRGTVSMNAVAKHLAAGLDVRRATRVVGLVAEGDRWAVQVEHGEVLSAEALVVTAPVPQALELLTAGGTALAPGDDATLRAIAYDPCLAVMVPMAVPSGLPDPGAVAPLVGPIDWIADNRAKGISVGHGITIHAGAGFSVEHWDAPDDRVVDLLLHAVGEHTGSAPVPSGDVSVQRWRYARPSAPHPHRCLVAAGPAPLVFSGDAFGEAKVEGAVLSGVAAAAAVRDLLADR
jgi:predicted NAD/FAD-dependent oxidoreductase